MKLQRFEWVGAAATAAAARSWSTEAAPPVEVDSIGGLVREGGDAALLALTKRYDAPAAEIEGLRVDPAEAAAALAAIDPTLREALETAAANIGAVAAAQLGEERTVDLPQGHSVRLREVPVGAAGLYAPGGRAAYPSSVLMTVVPARVAGVERIALVTPPAPDGRVHPVTLAAAALCEVEEIYAIGGAQAIFALAFGTETIEPVDVVAGPGNAWVQEAKRAVYGTVGIDSLAGPSELMVIAGHDTEPEWVALDLCAQAEHGDGALLVAAVELHILDAVAAATEKLAELRPSVSPAAPLALVHVPDSTDAVDLCNAFAPEHVEIFEEDASLLAERITTAGCVFAGRWGATAFGDYAAGSNHVLPTGGSGRFTGPLGPGAFRRRISTVEIDHAAAAALAPSVDAIARAEGFPVHAESAMIRR
ncbi:MAG TPA: histidinol dehydrogenase [Solirubrobacterales bacterium]|jgi:histidinol dehydrogenase|nr:histidinol dehydrogenase [Solirubrobacterales bacterium]